MVFPISQPSAIVMDQRHQAKYIATSWIGNTGIKEKQ